MRRSHAITRDNYNKLSKWYDCISGNAEWYHNKIGIDRLGIQPDWRVLDIGFGTGKSLVYLNKYVNNKGAVFGVDMSDGMVNKAKSRINEQLIDPNIFITIGDATELPFKDKRFDAICMSFTLELFDSIDIPNVLFECKRVLKNNAKLMIIGMLKDHEHRLAVKLYELFHKWFPVTVDCRPIYISKELSQAGLKLGFVEESSIWGLPLETVVAINLVEK